MSCPFRILAGMGLLVFSLCAFPQNPAVSEQLQDDDVKVLEPIAVVGSRIKRIDIEGPAPVMVFDRQDLEQAGINTLEEFARNLPINWGPLGDAEGMLAGRDVGYADFDLRGIGTDSTLTLVNGRRLSPYARYSGTAIDINAIPISAIERIEVLKDGASAIYGAEAIAGVVNIILRTDYDGIEVNAGYGITEHNDNQDLLADVVTGKTYDRGSFMFSLSWYDRDPVLSRDRDWAATNDFTDVGGPRRGSPYGSPPALLRYDTFTFEADPECGTDPQVSWVTQSGEDAYCRFNYKQYDGLITGIERIGAALSGRFELKPDLSLFGDVLYSYRESENNQAPAPIGGSPLIETWTGLPYVPASHPDNPFGTDGELAARILDVGNREYSVKSNAWRVVAGLDGMVGNWDWLASVLLAQNDVKNYGENEISQMRFQQALLGQGGPDGDSYYNPFGYLPQNDPAVKDWMSATSLGKHKSKTSGFEFEVNGFFGALAGGPVGMAAGAEFRKQKLDQWWDEETSSGDLAGFGVLVPVSADRSVASAFIEFSLPLHETFEAQLAARYDHYDDFGPTTNPKVALRWQPVPALLFRASYSTSFSPPSFNELFDPAALGLEWFIDTPRCEITGLYEDCDWWPYPTELSGNPDLDPEEGTSWFAGMVWQPEFIPGLNFQLDFWRFDHKNRIILFDPQIILDAGGDQGIIREPPEADGTPGRIERIESTYVNAEKLLTRGFDTTIRYAWPTERAGDFDFSLIHTYIDKYEFPDTGDLWLEPGKNYAGKTLEKPIPRNRGNVNLSWSMGHHGAAANVHYVGEYELGYQWVDGQRTDEPWTVDSHTTLDLQYSYIFEKLNQARIRLGCINCTGEIPPLTYFSEPGPYHDPRGRVYYIRWQQPIR